jgi:glycosyltransferase involved in cell wall biosynthesis
MKFCNDSVSTRPVLDGDTSGGRLARVLCALALDPSLKLGSIEEQTLALARAFHDEGGLFLPVFVRPPASELAAAFANSGLAVEVLDLNQFSLRKTRTLLDLIRTHRIEMINWNFYAHLRNCYVWTLRLLAPTVRQTYTDHLSRPPGRPATASRWRRTTKRVLGRSYDQVFCISDYVLEDLRTRAGWNRLKRYYYFINTDRFQPNLEVRRCRRAALGGGADGGFVVLVVANLIWQKGVDVALRAVAGLPENVVLWIAGEGPAETDLRALSEQLKLTSRVHFLGLQRHVEPMMQAADCLVCPSLWNEGLGLVNLEGLACGLPVVASNVGGIPECIDSGRDGLLFPPGDHQALGCHLRQLLDSPDVCRRLGEQARRTAVEQFGTARRIGDDLRLYRIGMPHDEAGTSGRT